MMLSDVESPRFSEKLPRARPSWRAWRAWKGAPFALWGAIGLLAIALRVAYLAVTPFNLRTHDVDGHVEYIEYLLNHHSFPPNDGGWSFYHPGLYFLISALQWRLLDVLHVSRAAILVSLQAQSVLWELGYAAFAFAAARLWLDELPEESFGKGLLSRRALAALAAVLIAVWPATIIHSVRIGNDDLVYLFFGASFYFTTRWWTRKRERDLHLAAVASALGVVTKTNALVLFGILGLLLLVHMAGRERERRPLVYLKRFAPMVVLALASFAIALGSAIKDTLTGKRTSFFVGNSDWVTNKLIVGNRAENYIWFDLPAFVNHAFISPWDDPPGRQWFWNYFFKTSLFGEFHFDSILVWNLAVLISVAFLGLLVFAVGSEILGAFGLAWLPITLTMTVLVASLAYLRMRHPWAPSAEFRYILPVLTPFLLAYLRGLTRCDERGWVRIARGGALLGWIFAGLSIALVVAIAALRKP